MTDKPELVGYFMSFKQEGGEFRVSLDHFTTREDDRRKEAFGDDCRLLPVVWLTDHESSRAADKARIAGLEADLSQANQRAGLWKSNYADANERIDELLGLLRDVREYVYCELENERANFKGHENCSTIPSIEADLARIDAALERHKC